MRLEVGRIGRAHGLRGEVSLIPISNIDARFQPGSVLYAGDRELEIVAARKHQDRYVVRFRGIDDRTEVEKLRNQIVTADPLEGDDDELFVHELIGSEVRDRSGAALGVVTAVEANPAHDLLVLDSGALVPVVFVVAREPGVVVIDPPEGLFDL